MQEQISVQLVHPKTNEKKTFQLMLKTGSDGTLEQQMLNSITLYLSDIPELLYIVNLILTDGYYSDIKTHKEIMLSFLDKCSYLLPLSVCQKYVDKGIIRNDKRIMELYNTIISRLQLLCYSDTALAVTKQEFIHQIFINEILDMNDEVKSVYLFNPINRSKIVGHGLILWFRSLIKQIDDNCFDYSDYIPKEMEAQLGNGQSGENSLTSPHN